ncbi:hypothetical protein AGMMS49531_11190 [Endomicrobiia bacterium]|nr:hypothetical protein AGMMS49531_11190 [Endomicrobiia bacterium]
MHIRHERCRRHVSQKVMIAIVSFGLMLSSCTTLHKTPTPSPFETAYKTCITAFDAWHENRFDYKDHKELWLNSDDLSKASDNLMNVAKEAKPFASDALKNAINDAFNRYEIRSKANEDNYDKMIYALANAYKVDSLTIEIIYSPSKPTSKPSKSSKTPQCPTKTSQATQAETPTTMQSLIY